MRVLRPGGRLLIADPGAPWVGITMLHAVKER